mmetsp:Transcript_72447/g.141976  ORF Transcript_72447/g.141976 Transcript_72447/m.141976 type:complete len:322 (+) Transcript_72447:538-1503(+)
MSSFSLPAAMLLITATSLPLSRPYRRILARTLPSYSKSPTTEADYARIFASDPVPAKNTRPPSMVLEQDPWQYQLFRSPGSGNPYAEMTNWYLQSWRESDVDEDIAHWGITYREYVDEYVRQFSELIPISQGMRVFESAVGSGWLIRGLLELKAADDGVDDGLESVEWNGNDILPDALSLARRDVPGGQFVLGDSANLTWVPKAAYDVAVCGYIEPSPDAIVAGGYLLTEVQDWVGNWVKQMTRLVKPGGVVCVGAVQEVLEAYDLSEKIVSSWWEESARSDAYGWGVDPDLVTTRALRSDLLEREWGPRYCVRLIKNKAA